MKISIVLKTWQRPWYGHKGLQLLQVFKMSLVKNLLNHFQKLFFIGKQVWVWLVVNRELSIDCQVSGAAISGQGIARINNLIIMLQLLLLLRTGRYQLSSDKMMIERSRGTTPALDNNKSSINPMQCQYWTFVWGLDYIN